MLALTLIVFGLVVAGVTFGLRNEVRSQILHRESEALYSATILQRDLLEESDEALGLEEDDYALFSIVMRTSRMRGVVAMRVFDSKGIFFDSVPVEVIDDDLTKGDLDRLASTGPEARFHEAYPFDELFIGGIGKPAATAPLLQVLLPLSHREETSGAVLSSRCLVWAGHSAAWNDPIACLRSGPRNWPGPMRTWRWRQRPVPSAR
jgi:hypothetical protein